MKKIFLSLLVFATIQMAGNTQIILANPNVTNKVSETQELTPQTPKPVVFRVSLFTGGDVYYIPGKVREETGTVLNLTLKEFDLGNNISGNTFVAPEHGIYHFDVRLYFTYWMEGTDYVRYYLMLNKNGVIEEKEILMNPPLTSIPLLTMSVSTTILLMKGDVITTSFNTDTPIDDKFIRINSASFSGFRVAPLK